jgi:hypothetical protein
LRPLLCQCGDCSKRLLLVHLRLLIAS